MFTFDFPIQNKSEEKQPVKKEQPKMQQQNSQQQYPQQQKPQEQKPQPPQNQKIVHDLDEKTKNIEVNEHVEIIPVTENSATGIKRYSLDD
mgnify:CR=1 FL=1